MLPSADNDVDIWGQLIHGDEEAFSLLFKKYYTTLFTYGKSITTHNSLVIDAIQDIFADIWIYRQKLSTPVSIKAYLLSSLRKRIARRIERDHIFRQSDAIEDVEFSGTFTILDQLITDEETRIKVEQLNTLINRLPPRQKEAIYLRYYQNLTLEQIAEMMQMNYQSVVNLLHRAVKQLRLTWAGEVPCLPILLLMC